MANTGTASLTIAELREFASFTACEQRYIKRSLDVGLGRQDAFKLWARDADETASIRSQYVAYQELQGAARRRCPSETGFEGDRGLHRQAGPRHRLRPRAGADRRASRAYRFLYERLLGAGNPPVAAERRSAPPPRCRRSAPTAARACSSRSAKPPPPRPAGPTREPCFYPANGWRSEAA